MELSVLATDYYRLQDRLRGIRINIEHVAYRPRVLTGERRELPAIIIYCLSLPSVMFFEFYIDCPSLGPNYQDTVSYVGPEYLCDRTFVCG